MYRHFLNIKISITSGGHAFSQLLSGELLRIVIIIGQNLLFVPLGSRGYWYNLEIVFLALNHSTLAYTSIQHLNLKE
jgi:hypothetical protein